MSGVTREQKIALWRVLSCGVWLLKRDILAIAVNFAPSPDGVLTDRSIRAVCAAEPDKFLSSQKGYKRTDFATDDEIRIANADIQSRIKCLRKRSEALERVLDERNGKQQAFETFEAKTHAQDRTAADYYGSDQAMHDALNEDLR